MCVCFQVSIPVCVRTYQGKTRTLVVMAQSDLLILGVRTDSGNWFMAEESWKNMFYPEPATSF